MENKIVLKLDKDEVDMVLMCTEYFLDRLYSHDAWDLPVEDEDSQEYITNLEWTQLRIRYQVEKNLRRIARYYAKQVRKTKD